MRDPMISTEELASQLDRTDLKILDATWNLDGSDARAPFRAMHLPGAAFFDIDAVADNTSPLPHMLPTPEAFAEAVSAMGIGSGDEVVVYDQIGVWSAARVWWTFRVFGHDRVRVLDGGLPKWRAENRPTESGDPVPGPGLAFAANYRAGLVRAFDQILEDVASGRPLIDARPQARFEGTAPEPRAGLRSGHIPGSLSLPVASVLEDGRLKDEAALRAVFEAAGQSPDRPITLTCGSGITASILALAAARLGVWDAAVYDGSWSEWGSREDAPITTGKAHAT